jgi:RHS repeat-associated protein
MRRFLLHQSFAPAVLLIVALFCGVVKSQTTAARPDRGINPGGSYSISDIENINLENGNVNLSIPLASLPPIAGGKLKLTVSAIYNSKLWNVTRSEENGSYFPYRNYVVDTPQQSDAGGWQIGGGYGLFFREAREDFSYQLPVDSSQGYEWHRLTDHNWYKLVLRTPDGAEHELRPSGAHEMYYGLDHPRTYLWGYYCDTPDTTGSPMRYESSDGTYLSAIVNPAGHASGIRSTVFLSDGTQVISYSNGVQRIRDNNGNTVKIYSDSNGQHYQDEQTGREIRVADDPGVGEFGQKQVWYQTVGGGWQHIDINFGETVVQGKVYKTQDWNPSIYSETGELGAECTRHQQLPDLHLPVIRDIIFPVTEPNVAGRHFTFAYTSDTNETATTTGIRFACGDLPQTYTRTASHGMGALSHIETPAGAVIDYTYTGASQHDFIGIEGPDQIVKETLTKKVVTHDGGIQDTWDYDVPSSGEGTVSSVTNPDGSSSSQHFFPIDQGFGREIGYDEPRAGLVYYSSDGLSETYRHWITGTGIATGSNHSTTFNPLVDAEYTSLVGTSLMTAKLYEHDYNGNITKVTEYDWFDSSPITRDAQGVPTGPPANATILRVTNTSYYNPAPAQTSANYYTLRTLASGTPSILNAVQETTTGPAISRLSYDGQAYGAPPTIGNLTSQSVWDDLDNKWITSSQSYGPYGNVDTKTDARGKVTHFFYDDLTHALPNRVQVDPQNGSGLQTATIAYDFSSGRVTSQTDPNGNVSTIDYTNQRLGSVVDPFGRPGVTSAPAVNGQSRQTRTYYADSTRTVTVVSDLNTSTDGLLKSQVVSDMLGRTFETRQYETTNDYITVRHSYDSANRIEKTSNAFRSGEPILWTTAVSDVHGRVITVTTPDSAVVSTSYSANTVTVTDQAGKQRKSISDALGRLKEIYEDPSGLNYLTSYGYDVFGNLLTVNQGSQTRTFNYDSLSRLRSASNPESGTISYAYDDDGNLTQKTDARGVVGTYAYDGLNRNTSVSYTNDPAGTPSVNRYYDGWRDGAIASPNIPNSLGRLWQTETAGSAGSRTTINGFDALGRPTSESQQFYASSAWSQAYTTQRGYNLAGGVTLQTYPSGRTTAYTYDSAGRAKTFSGTLGDGQQKDYSTEILYSPFGAMTKEKFGTDTAIYNKLFYNSRGQLAEIRESTSWTDTPNNPDTTWNRGAIINHYSNNCWGMCGGSTSTTAMTDNNGNLKKQDVYVPTTDALQNAPSVMWTQAYDYDSLNRLQRVHENTGNTQTDWQQEYVYDRYGNRTIHQTNTYGTGVNKKDFTVNTANNRLGVPGVQSGTMTYDDAGNLTTDTYSGNGVSRVYDAENRMNKETQGSSVVAGEYTYNSDGQRVRRKVGGVETWQVYGLDGELLAEYAQNSAVTAPQKEYGYRNGQLLITAEVGTSGGSQTAENVAWTNVVGATVSGNSLTKTAASAWGNAGAASTRSIASGDGYVEFSVTSLLTGMVALSHTDTNQDYTTMEFALLPNSDGNLYVFESGVNRGVVSTYTTADVFRVAVESGVVKYRKNGVLVYTSTVTPTYPLLVDAGLYHNGGTFSNVKIDGNLSGSTTENVAWTNVVGATVSGNNLTKTAATGWGNAGAASTRSIASGDGYVEFSVTSLNTGMVALSHTDPNQDYTTMEFALLPNSDGNLYVFESGVNRGVVSTYTTSDVFRVAVEAGVVKYRNNGVLVYTSTVAPTYPLLVDAGLYYNGGTQANVVISGNLSGVTGGASMTANINWLVTDQLGTPRMIFDKTGSLATTKRHDYAPFGEELFSGLRPNVVGYGAADSTRQKFTSKERDTETGLDYFGARYYASTQGRFMGVDPLGGHILNPQSLNKYAYVINNPLRLTDPTGMYVCTDSKKCDSDDDKKIEKARQRDLKSKDADVVRGAKSYGDPTKDNGVTLKYGDPGKGKDGDTKHAYELDPNDPNGIKFRAKETVILRSGLTGADLDAAVGHEGSHVADAQEFISTIGIAAPYYDLSKNLTTYDTEVRAYGVTQSILSSGNEHRDFGQCGLDPCRLGAGVMPAKVREVIDRMLADPENRYGSPPKYGISSKNPGPRLYPGLTTPDKP